MNSTGTAQAINTGDYESDVPTSTGDPLQSRLVSRLSLLWKHRRNLGKGFVVGAVIGVCIAFALPKSYEASTQLMPPDAQSGSSMALLASLAGRSSGLANFAGDLVGVKSSGALFTGILHSRSVQDRIITRFGLKAVYGARLDKTARSVLSDRTVITEDRKSGIITIVVTDRDPIRAAAIARGYIDELDHTVAQLSTSAARREREFLEQRLATVKKELDKSSNDLSQFQSKNATIDVKEQGRTMMEAAASLMGQLVAAESELQGLRQIYAPTNVRVRSLEARVAELRRQLNAISGSSDDGKENPVPAYPNMRQLPLLGVTYADLYRRAKVQETVYEVLTQEYELAKVQEAKETPSVKVLDEAVVPETKSFPPRTLITIIFSIIGGFCAAAFYIVRSVWADIDPSDPRKTFATDVYSELISAISEASFSRRFFRDKTAPTR